MEEIFHEPCDAYYKIFTDKPDTGYKYRFLSPFEFKDTLIQLAKKSYGNKMLNAGRGNPNFFSTIPRYVFALLTVLSVKLGDELCEYDDLGYMPSVKGIGAHFDKLVWAQRGLEEGKILKQLVDKMHRISGMPRDAFIHNLVVSTIGCFYPDPPRVQNFAEPVLAEFLDKTVYRSSRPLKGNVKIMPTEGAAAAILYVFNSLKYNGLVVPGDQIGVITPIFSPYLEIPTLENYDLKQICVKASETQDWDIPQSEIDKIANKNMKALFLVNPTNPTAMSLTKKAVKRIAATVKKSNPDLIILEDNVYAPFVEEFNDFFNVLPKNTIGVYSFSKYFGTTGWRLGTIVLRNNNIIDNKLLKEAPESVHTRYKMLTTHPERIKFMDRVLADSRQVAEAHVAGLSTPQQTLMCLLATFDLLDKERVYSHKLKSILEGRMVDLLAPLKYKLEDTPLNSKYYIVINIAEAANGLMGGTKFGEYLTTHRDPLEFLMKLAKNYGVVLLPAVGFAGPFWGVRVSLANLSADSFGPIGESLRSLIDEYYEDFKKWEAKNEREEKKKA